MTEPTTAAKPRRRVRRLHGLRAKWGDCYWKPGDEWPADPCEAFEPDLIEFENDMRAEFVEHIRRAEARQQDGPGLREALERIERDGCDVTEDPRLWDRCLDYEHREDKPTGDPDVDRCNPCLAHTALAVLPPSAPPEPRSCRHGIVPDQCEFCDGAGFDKEEATRQAMKAMLPPSAPPALDVLALTEQIELQLDGEETTDWLRDAIAAGVAEYALLHEGDSDQEAE